MTTLSRLAAGLREPPGREGSRKAIAGSDGSILTVYSRSVRIEGSELYFVGREKEGKHLYIATIEDGVDAGNEFRGRAVSLDILGSNLRGKRCPFAHENAERLRQVFPFARPVLIGREDSFGFGDRLGIANPAHLRALEGSLMRPILAQQSVRELDRTERSAEDVLDAASWAVFQEGYTAGFGADADHLKTIDDIDRYARAGFTMFTFDPSAFVMNEAARLSENELRSRARQAETGGVRLDDVLARYANRAFRLEDGTVLRPGTVDMIRAFVKYGGVLSHSLLLYRHLKHRHASLPSEVEISVDETDTPTTPAEHLFVAGELKRMGVEWVSLAPRFIGDFEKGVDYRGNLDAFSAEYLRHVGIANMMGPYKISFHSGSDKFSVYRIVGRLGKGNVHVKTAGTSYLEALRTAAMVEPELVREILGFSIKRYAGERQSYHVSAQLDRVPRPEECSGPQLINLFDQHDARQVFHVTFGKVLTARDKQGNSLFRDRLMDCLDRNEDIHYATIIRHFRKHLEPFSHQRGETP